MQLVAYGAQDIYLTGNPQITFFKVVYRRHTNFSMETIQQTLVGASAATEDSSSTCTISRNGDLVYKVYVSDTAGAVDADVAGKGGSSMIKEVDLEIGGQKIDRHYQEWMNVWTELSTPESKAMPLKVMQGDLGVQSTTGVGLVQVPLQFWFCRNPGLALPLIALQYHEVKLIFTWGAGSTSATPIVWCDYIYLDTDERRRFAQVSHEYLIEQIQKETYVTETGDKKLNFNHPVKELIWVPTNTITDGTTYQIKLNGHDRFAAQEKEYFTLRQPIDYHTAVPRQNLPKVAGYEVAADENRTVVAWAGTESAGNSGIFTANDTVTANDGFKIVNTTTLTFGTGTTAVAGDELVDLKKGDLIAAKITTPNTDGGSDAGVTTSPVDGGQTALTTTRQILGLGEFYYGRLAADAVVTNSSTVTLTLTSEGMMRKDGTSIVTAGTGTGNALAAKFYNAVDESSVARTSKMSKSICVYSFALKPEEHQPSGTCNFSRIDNAQLNIGVNSDGGGTIYAVNYNVLRIMSGMGGLAYSN